jgi:hypothetical protein
LTWVEPAAGAFTYEEAIVYCELCGRPNRGRTWRVVVDGKLRSFCDETCEADYCDYWLPRYGAS